MKIFGSTRNKSEEWIRLYDKGLRGLHHSPNTVTVIKSRKLRLSGKVTRIEEGRTTFKYLTDKTTRYIPLG